MRHLYGLAGWVLVLSCALAGAESPAALDGPHRPFHDELLDRLVGSWRVSGTIQGKPADQTMEAAWVLNHQFLRLDYVEVDPVSAGEPRYQATVFLGRDNLSERYVAHWIDVFGGRASTTLGYGSRSGHSITLRFEYPSGPFENRFIWRPDTGTWRFELRARDSGGEWVPFADLEAAPAGPVAAPSPGGVAGLEEQVRATEAAFARTMADRDHAAFASFVAEEAVFVGRSVLRGRQAVAEGWKRYFETPDPPFAWAPEQVVVMASGTLALSSGPVFAGEQRVGTFNSVWQRQADGSWKTVLDNGCPPCGG